MPVSDPAATIRKCLAMRSSDNPNIRQVAVDRPLALCRKHGLEPARFGLTATGQPAAKPADPPRSRGRGYTINMNFDSAAFSEAMARVARSMDARFWNAYSAGVRDTVRRAFDEADRKAALRRAEADTAAARAEAMRERIRAAQAQAEADFLWDVERWSRTYEGPAPRRPFIPEQFLRGVYAAGPDVHWGVDPAAKGGEDEE